MKEQNIKISPSLLACDFLHLEDELKATDLSGADTLHADVMDGVYVPNISFGFDIIKKIGTASSLPIDAHLMISRPQKYIEALRDAGVASVTVHTDFDESSVVRSTLQSIRDAGMKVGIALRPRFSAEDVIPYLDICDMILVMTVEPGFGGQRFMDDMLPKIRRAAELAADADHTVSVQVDGGIVTDTIGICAESGADNFVVGTAFYKSDDLTAAAESLRRAALNRQP